MRGRGADMSWLERYKPTDLKGVVGNKTKIEQMKGWLKMFKIDPTKCKSMLMINGPTGCGKSLIVPLLLKYTGYRCVQYGASDVRKNKELSDILYKCIGHRNVLDMMMNNQSPIGLLLDDLDTYTTNVDRGGLSALLNFIKPIAQQKNGNQIYPIICCYINRSNKILTQLKKYALVIELKKIYKPGCKQIMDHIAKCEGLQIDADAGEKIIQICDGDLRMLINQLEQMALTSVHITLETVVMTVSEKNRDYQLYDAVKILFKRKLSVDELVHIFEMDKIKLPLMLHENYPQVIKDNISNKRKCADIFVENDMYQNKIFQLHQWNLSPHCALNTLYPLNRIFIANRSKMPVIKFTNVLHRIQFSKKNLKLFNTIRIETRLIMENSELLFLGELLTHFLFIAKDISRVIEIMNQYNLRIDHESRRPTYNKKIDDLGIIIRLAKYYNKNSQFKYTTALKQKIKKLLV